MAFRAKRLRVQLPCGEEGSVLDRRMRLDVCQVQTCYVLTRLDLCQPPHLTGIPGGPPPHCRAFSQCGWFETPPVCNYPGSAPPQCHHGTPHPCDWFGTPHGPRQCHDAFQTLGGPFEQCEGHHWFSVCHHLGSIVVLPTEVDADALPLLRRQLELRLEEIEMAAEAAKAEVRAQLDDIAVAEQAVREHRGEGDDEQ